MTFKFIQIQLIQNEFSKEITNQLNAIILKR